MQHSSDDGREHQPVGHLEEAHPQPDQRQVDDQQHEIADPHRRDHAPEQVGLLGHDLRTRDDAVDGHGADHQGHHRVGRDAEREQRNEGRLGAGVVGRLGPRHALDGAASEARGVLGELLLQRVGGERAEHGAVAGQQAEQASPGTCRARSAWRALPEVLAIGQQIADGSMHDVARLLRLEVAQDLGKAEHAHGETATSMPSAISLQPNVRRSSPLSRSVPTVDSRMPTRMMAIALAD